MLKAADEVHRPVDRVDDEKRLGVEPLPLVELLAEKVRFRHGGAQLPRQQLLHAAVVFGHDVARAALALGEHVVRLEDQSRGLALGGADRLADLVGIHKKPSLQLDFG